LPFVAIATGIITIVAWFSCAAFGDQLLNLTHTHHHDHWKTQSEPRGMFWKPPELQHWSIFERVLGRNNHATLRWMLRTPKWLDNEDAKQILLLLRISWVTFILSGAATMAIVSALTA
jgi:hypothetical protein